MMDKVFFFAMLGVILIYTGIATITISAYSVGVLGLFGTAMAVWGGCSLVIALIIYIKEAV